MRIFWEDAASLCEEYYGAMVNWTEEYFLCPECGEPLYKVDWENVHNWDECPICEFPWEEERE